MGVLEPVGLTVTVGVPVVPGVMVIAPCAIAAVVVPAGANCATVAVFEPASKAPVGLVMVFADDATAFNVADGVTVVPAEAVAACVCKGKFVASMVTFSAPYGWPMEWFVTPGGITPKPV